MNVRLISYVSNQQQIYDRHCWTPILSYNKELYDNLCLKYVKYINSNAFYICLKCDIIVCSNSSNSISECLFCEESNITFHMFKTYSCEEIQMLSIIG